MRPSRCLALIAALLAVLRCVVALAGQDISLVYVDVDSSPFQTGAGRQVADPPGLAVEVVAKAVRLAGHRPRFRRMPQMRMLRMLEEGQIDGAFIFSYTPERAALYDYPMRAGEPDSELRVTRIRYSAYRLKGATAQWDGQVFSGLSRPVGVNTGWVMASLLAQRGQQVDDSGRGYAENFGKLRLGRIDAYVTLEPAAESFLQRSGLQELFEKIGPPVQEKDYFLLFSKRFLRDSPDVAQAIWARVAQVRQVDEGRLYKKYADTLAPH